ncbi:glycosyltransferase [Ilumatobacter sp.]|uniref:glycosyltransferase n=1 Tax=Ilumatobacter sp. TaxID=1967498 RepID=UPI003AF980CE
MAYSYVGFPLLVLLRGRFLSRPWSGEHASGEWPSATVLIAAFNEEAAIADKVRTVLGQDYPGRLDCVVVSDGSTDGTVAAAISVGEADRLRVMPIRRSGKATALNRGIEAASGSVIVFTDANSRLAPDAVRRLLSPFADPEIGGVAGDQRYEGDDDAVGERTYWDLDRVMKHASSRAGSVSSATGALYAVRRELVPTVPDGVTDDFYVSTAVIDAGRRLVFAGDAVAFEPPASSLDPEYHRKVRVMTRGLRAVLLRRRLLDPRRTGFYAPQLFSHKVLRRLSVVPLVVTGLAAAALRRRPCYAVVARAQLVLLAAMAAAWTWTRSGRRSHPAIGVVAYFGMVNVAALHALVNLITGRRIDRWTPQRDGD